MKTLTYAARKRFTMYFGLIEGIIALCILIVGIICRNTANILQDSDTFSAFIGISAGMLGAVWESSGAPAACCTMISV